MDCRMASAIECPVFLAAGNTSFSRSEGTASGYVSDFTEKSYISRGLFQERLKAPGAD
jgi:hypothetical protein